MKKSKYHIVLSVIFFLFSYSLLTSCSSGPNNNEITSVIKKKLTSDRAVNGKIIFISFSIVKNNGSQKFRDSKAYSYTIDAHYIVAGASSMGYLAQCPTRQCVLDKEFSETSEFLLSKNQWEEWIVVDSRKLDRKKINEFWRSTEANFQDFYKSKFPEISKSY